MRPRLHAVPSLQRLASLLGEAGRAWLRHRAQSRGAALAYYALFSLSPLLVLLLAAAGRVLGPHAARGEVFARLEGLLGPAGARAAESVVLDANLPGAGAVAAPVALALLLLGATTVFAELKDCLDEVWDCGPRAPRGLLGALRGRFLALAAVGALGLLLAASVALSAGLALLGPAAPRAAPFLARGLSLALLGTLVAVLYRLLPACGPAWGDAAKGACLTLALAAAAARLLEAYLARGALQSTFGAAGSLAAFLLWVYGMAQVFLLGAEFARALGAGRR
ncbi:YhjD/YihY/BrkB family envelope integrity protein [Mesoterricola sediminis]|uniref:Membrane protein n=1 Tax=Mesoterricola sediminis TaxID=2927980 RepID=A0AA48GTY1_9BACT|nr:YhjD/YihY/BrkB family envelope integrity protein [Mesoterricola sediminis]BDU76139.1 membrane protein [Mesoterricola sediminis]